MNSMPWSCGDMTPIIMAYLAKKSSQLSFLSSKAAGAVACPLHNIAGKTQSEMHQLQRQDEIIAA